MLLSIPLMEKLKANWGIPAETMECFAEARLLDPSNGWEAYLLALSDDEDTFVCLIMGKLEQVPTSALIESCNNCGEYLQIDKSFRRRQAKEIYKKMNEGKWINEI